jgi:hypothetical protein
MTIRVLARWIPTVAALAVLPVAAASAAAASTAQTSHHGANHTVTAVTHLVNRGDSGGNGNNWAYDNFTRTAKITFRGVAPLIDCLTFSGNCYAFTASLSDHGHFVTIPGVLAPNQGAPYIGSMVQSAVRGHFHGYGLFTTFYATAMPDAGLVPSNVNGNAHPSYLWPTLFFPSSAIVTSPNENDWGYFYYAPQHQSWVDASFNAGGQLATDGNITG